MNIYNFLALKKANQTATITVSELHGDSLLNDSLENCGHFRKLNRKY
jgi:hypothetical protein